jgi:hypothetical protein
MEANVNMTASENSSFKSLQNVFLATVHAMQFLPRTYGQTLLRTLAFWNDNCGTAQRQARPPK